MTPTPPRKPFSIGEARAALNQLDSMNGLVYYSSDTIRRLIEELERARELEKDLVLALKHHELESAENDGLRVQVDRLEKDWDAAQRHVEQCHATIGAQAKEIEWKEAESRRDALDGQAALDEANNEVVRLTEDCNRVKALLYAERTVTKAQAHELTTLRAKWREFEVAWDGSGSDRTKMHSAGLFKRLDKLRRGE